MRILEGKTLARTMLRQVKANIATLPQPPGLVALLVGNDPSSVLYLGLKEKTAKTLGVAMQVFRLPQEALQTQVIDLIKQANQDIGVQGILLQLPLPEHLNVHELIAHIDPRKDVDGFLPSSGVVSPTVQSIIALIKQGMPHAKGATAALLVNSDAFYAGIQEVLTTEGIELIDDMVSADIVVVAKGQPGCLRARMIKEGALVVDVGISVVNGQTVGDSAPDVQKKAGALTPVPGGVGPLTVAFLFKNLYGLANFSR